MRLWKQRTNGASRAGRQEGDVFVLLLDVHHIVADGTSVELLVRELLASYHGRALTPLSLGYKDFAAWQNDQFASQVLEPHERYWTERLRGAPRLELTTELPRPATQSFRGDRVRFRAGAELTQAVRAVAAEAQATVYMVLLAALNVVLAKYTGQEDILIGTPVAGRENAATRPMMGVFINTLVLRNEPRAELTLREFLQAVRARALEAYSHQRYPFERLVERLALPRDPSRNPVFDVLFVMQPTTAPDTEVDGIRYSGYELANEIAKFDLTLQASFEREELKLELEYATSLFSRAFVDRMGEHFLQVLRQLVEQPTRKISHTELLTEGERGQLLGDFNATSRDYVREETCVSCFRERARVAADAAAVSFGDSRLSYGELDGWSDRIASALLAREVGAGALVGVSMQPSLALLPALLGVLKAGAAYVPLDPSYPQERLALMLEDCGVNLVVCDGTPPPSIRALATVLDARSGEVGEGGRALADVRIHPGDPAYLIYTSGSTGRPKGVVVNHGNVRNLIEAMRRVADFGAGRKIASVTTISFDIFVLESLVPLALGLEVVLADQDARLEPARLAALLAAHQVNILQMTPSRMKLMLEGAPDPAQYAGLDTVFVGGEAFPSPLLGALRQVTRARVINVYGPTETTVWSSSAELVDGEAITIGKPLANTRMYVVDKDGNLCPLAGRGGATDVREVVDGQLLHLAGGVVSVRPGSGDAGVGARAGRVDGGRGWLRAGASGLTRVRRRGDASVKGSRRRRAVTRSGRGLRRRVSDPMLRRFD